MFPDQWTNLKSSDLSLYEYSISYSTLKRSFAPRILTTTSDKKADDENIELAPGSAADDPELSQASLNRRRIVSGTNLNYP